MTGRIEKTVFISYRRTNFYTALAVYQDLTQHGYDVFFDFQSIDSGDFEKIIIENIKAKAHFLVILSPTALERCNEPSDWLRREIEMAIDEKRNIVPLMMEGFDFASPSMKQALSGKLSLLGRYNGLRLASDYFFEAMERLRKRYLNVSLEEVYLHPLSKHARDLSETQKAAASKADTVNTTQLRAQEKTELEYAYRTFRIPILGPIAAGLPLPELDPNVIYMTDNESNTIEIAQSLLPSRVKGENLFALEVKGNSMIDAMINDGDIIIMKPATDASNGEMVAIWLPRENEATLKYFFKEKDRYRLQPADPTMKPIFIKKSEPLEIKAEVIMVIRKSEKPLSS